MLEFLQVAVAILMLIILAGVMITTLIFLYF